MEENEGVRDERQEFDYTASEEAIAYLGNITSQDWSAIGMSETLMTTSGDKDFGEFEITVSHAEWQGKECYMIHITEECIVMDIPKVTNIIAHVDQNFTTLEQSIHEYKVPDRTIDSKTLMTLEGGKYVVQKTVKHDDFERQTHETYSTKQMQGFICEACHVVLQRLLLKKGIPDNMVFLTFDSETNLSSMTFKMIGEREIEVEDESVLTRGIECKLSSLMKKEYLWESFFIPDGRLMLKTEIGSDVTVRQLTLPRTPTPEQPDIITPLKWDEDMELLSQFTDRKEELVDDHNTYIRRHPEVKAILADFLQFLLMKKPDDIFDFAREFFVGMSLAPLDQSDQ
ncbi:ciliogenesis-associated TTC17-interacting protein-like [Dendronephthya gigantea]|uniref:ciliogenesis-associated TTC17-interacting protein-like n=1 Tax=Dendronephthya gigantea TaxID=151771 RepID=UPI001069C21E|nr:ciliogenesis-associated TTC17-interacting protein-like [Dendronephthya gigantea]XP_028396258.1 ciliogenesis-associated TTC17-interacting protein-like [Dendronephthya gigantea]XP_028396266.1 ciliogenesis-associated TTC17-interacting protein-like [Dendronephthya gigantea]